MTSTKQHSSRLEAWFFTLPALLLLCGVFLFPIGRAFWLSFFQSNLNNGLGSTFIGSANYERLLNDGHFWICLWNTTFFTSISVTIELVLGLVIAMVLNCSFKGRDLVRTITLVPWALPTAVMGLGWAWLFNDQFGLVNDLLLSAGFISHPLNWLGDPTLAMWSLIVADVWKTTPFIALLLLAGLQSIPAELYEAHELDGASRGQSFLRITLPLLFPQLLLATLFRFAQAFGVFDLVQVMTGGGPGGTTETVSLYLYANVMRYLDFGYGAALVVTTFFILVTVIFLTFGCLTLYRRAFLNGGL